MTELVDESDSGGRFRIGGQFNRWLNITSTIISEGAGDPHYGNYTCEVCVSRGTPQESCQESRTTLFIAGAPPDINEGEDNGIDIKQLMV